MRTWATRDAVFVAVTAAVVLSCTSQPGDDRTDAVEDTPGVDVAPRPSAEVTQALQAADPTLVEPVIVARTGGLAGYDDRIVIHPDGRVERLRGAEALGARVDDEILRQLAEAVASVDEGLGSEPSEIGADLLTYTVEWGERRIEFDTLDDDVRLQGIRDVLQRLFTP